jgi:hypothetical protein
MGESFILTNFFFEKKDKFQKITKIGCKIVENTDISKKNQSETFFHRQRTSQMIFSPFFKNNEFPLQFFPCKEGGIFNL